LCGAEAPALREVGGSLVRCIRADDASDPARPVVDSDGDDRTVARA
jgi:hypothetical protein